MAIVHARHPDVATLLVHHLKEGATTPCLREVKQVVHEMLEVGFEPLSWRALLAMKLTRGCGIGWQHEAAFGVERHHGRPHLHPPDRCSKSLVVVTERFGFLNLPHVPHHENGRATLPYPRLASPSLPRTFTCQTQPTGRRLEVAVDGLPLFGGAQFALDTTLVSCLALRWVCQEMSGSQ